MCVKMLTRIVRRQRLHTHPKDVCQDVCFIGLFCKRDIQCQDVVQASSFVTSPRLHTHSALVAPHTLPLRPCCSTHTPTPLLFPQSTKAAYTLRPLLHVYVMDQGCICVRTLWQGPRVSAPIPRVYMCIHPSFICICVHILHICVHTLWQGPWVSTHIPRVYMCTHPWCICICVYILHVCVHVYTPFVYAYMRTHPLYLCTRVYTRGGGLGSRPKKMYEEYLGDGVEYHLMSPTPRR